MRFTALAGAAICLTARLGSAIFADEAGVIDWHHVLLGHPRQDTTFLHQPHAGSGASLLYTLTDKGVIAAVNPKDGDVIWRHRLTDEPFAHASFRSDLGSENLISGVGSEVASWRATDGRQAWAVDLGAYRVRDLEILELETGKDSSLEKDCIALVTATSSNTVRRISAADGETVWEYQDTSGDIGHQVSVSTTQVYYESLHKALLGGYKIKVTTLDPVTGRQTSQYTLSSEGDISDPSNVLAVGANSAAPVIVWTDPALSVLKFNVIGSKPITVFDLTAANSERITKMSVLAPKHGTARSHFLIAFESAEHSWATVFHVDIATSSVTLKYSLNRHKGKSAFSSTEEGSNVFFTRITDKATTVHSSLAADVIKRWDSAGFGSPEDLDVVQPLSAATELNIHADGSVAVSRSAVLLSSGNWVSVRAGNTSWSRPEELANTVAAAYAYPGSTVDNLQKNVNEEAQLNVVSAYTHRWKRHLQELESLPGFLLSLPNKLLGALGMGRNDVIETRKASNAFGYHKVVVAVTSTNHIIGLDAGEHGKILWSFSIEDSAPVESDAIPYLNANPDAVMEYKPTRHSTTSVIFDAETGKRLASDNHAAGAERLLDVTRDQAGMAATLSGSSEQQWRLVTPANEEIVDVTVRPADEPIASIGRVLGDRKVLYKYVNPNLVLITTAKTSRKTLTVQLVESLTGTTLYNSVHEDVVPDMPFAAVVSENWIAYTYSEYSGDSGSKSSILVVADLYESAQPDERTSNSTARTSDKPPYIPVQSYIISEPISQLSVTQTAQGITSKNLLAVLPLSSSVVGIPKAVIDPRRPVGRDPTKDEQFEGLARYAPTLEFDPKWFLNHQRELFGVRDVTTSPAVLESTSLVFAYGLDVFGTRVSPSFSFDVLDKSFNKIQMLGTVLVLAVGTVVVKPLVARKGVDGRWQMPS